MAYVVGFLLPLKKNKVAAYRKMAQLGKKLWMKHGALEYMECLGDDLKNAYGGLGFEKVAKTKAGETVVFAFIVYKSKAHRDQVNKKVFSDPALQGSPPDMPFDPKRMAYGGFKVIVEGRRRK